MVLGDLVNHPTALAEEPGELRPLDGRTAGPEAAQDEGGNLQRAPFVDKTDLVLQRQVVTEPLRLFVGVHMAAHPRQQR